MVIKKQTKVPVLKRTAEHQFSKKETCLMLHTVQLADQIQKSHSLKISWLMMLKIHVHFIYFSPKE
jgi:hypothetical protein